MTKKQAKNGREPAQKSKVQDKPEESEHVTTAPVAENRERQETAVLEESKADSTKTNRLAGAAKVMEEGVHLVGKKAPEVASIVIHNVKKGVSAAYGTSSVLVRDAYHAASKYAEKYKHKVEIKKIKARREDTCKRLGSIIYTRVVINEEPPEKPLSDQEITSLLQQIQDLDDEVVRVGKELEKH